MDWSLYQALIIDDEPDNIRAAEYILRFNKVKVQAAQSGQEGLDCMRRNRPSFVLLDIQMPRLSGWDVLKTIRADPALADLAVIALTAHAMVNDMEFAMRAGFDGYITKPISPKSLMEQIARWLEQSAHRRIVLRTNTGDRQP